MPHPSSTKLLLLRRLSMAFRSNHRHPSSIMTLRRSVLHSSLGFVEHMDIVSRPPRRSFCDLNEPQGPTTIDYHSLLKEDEYHQLADSTIHDLLEKLEEYGDSVDIDGFDIDYGNQVLTLRLGSLGTYVLNKQTPNRQLWLSSPVSGPSRYDWDRSARAWVYRRTKTNLSNILESELEKLCGSSVCLS
ncbi:frataxin, mitochondrial-like isoform X1 [Impatiens glandulifera]|uniref:frataxin, mitochondrial-like isoform X1 n=1 Tax=Impatiens glandulifera TaxID=253017 RepID=UPI001FB13C27|nr:frataxin, mitochondrial-like isoform X1 [Impatiens glandulifera]